MKLACWKAEDTTIVLRDKRVFSVFARSSLTWLEPGQRLLEDVVKETGLLWLVGKYVRWSGELTSCRN